MHMDKASSMAATEAGSRAARALDDLYRRHVGDVYRYAYAVLGNRADAEDVTQTTFVNALAALERGERPRKPGNWLLAIAQNVVRQRWRHARVRPTEVELDADSTPAAEDDAAGPSISEMVKALGRIPASQREAIVMREFEGRSYVEIAEILGITTTALETLLFRARRSLAEELDNLVTCDLAEQAISRQLDGRLGRKERRRLDEHVRECPACARFELVQQRSRKAFKGLAILPLPATLTFFKGTNSAAAATLPTIGLAAAGTGGGAAAGGAATAGGLAVGGLAVKAAAVVAAVGVAGGVGYKGVQEVRDEPAPAKAKPARVERSQARADRAGARAIVEQPKAQAPRSRPKAPGPVERTAPDAAVVVNTGPPVATRGGRERAPGQQKKAATVDGGTVPTSARADRSSPPPNSNSAEKRETGATGSPRGEKRGQAPSASLESKASAAKAVKSAGKKSAETPAASAPGQIKKDEPQAATPNENANANELKTKDPKESKEPKEATPAAEGATPAPGTSEEAVLAPAAADNGAAHGNNPNAVPKK
jgi:RNA polymerase sigma factor (sigma-70 family)